MYLPPLWTEGQPIENSYYQPDVKQDNSCFHSRDSCHRFGAVFCYLPWWPFSSPSLLQALLELPVLLLQGLALSLLVEMGKGRFWPGEKLQGEGEQSDYNRASAGQRQSDRKFSKIRYQSRTPAVSFHSHKVDGEEVELQPHPAPWPGLKSAFWHQAFFSSCAQRPVSPASMNLVWKTSSTPNSTKVSKSCDHYPSTPQTGLVSTNGQNKKFALRAILLQSRIQGSVLGLPTSHLPCMVTLSSFQSWGQRQRFQ